MRPIRTSTSVVHYVQPEIAAEGNGLLRLVGEMHCRARFRIVETERHLRSDAAPCIPYSVILDLATLPILWLLSAFAAVLRIMV